MSEINVTWLAFGNMIALSFATLCYSLGGRAGGPGKWIRRFFASFILAVAINVTAVLFGKWWWPLLFAYPLLVVEYLLGYGGSTIPQRCFKRFLIVLLSAGIGVLLMFSLGGGLWLFIIQIIVGLTTVIFGVRNPVHAAAEENLVCFLNSGILLFYPFIV